MRDAASVQALPVHERVDILIVLLLIQGVVGLVGLIGLLVIGIAAGFPILTPAGAITLVGCVVPLLLASGVARGRGRARRVAIVYETLALLSVFLNLVLALLPDVQMDLTLTGLLTSVVLPVAIIGLLAPPEPAAITATGGGSLPISPAEPPARPTAGA